MPSLNVLFPVVALIAVACQAPVDPEGTLENVRGGTLVVGYLDQAADKSDPRISNVAEALEAEVEWRTGAPDILIDDLKTGRIHLIAGGLVKSSALVGEVGVTAPVGQMAVGDKIEDEVFAVRPGESAFLLFVNRHVRR